MKILRLVNKDYENYLEIKTVQGEKESELGYPNTRQFVSYKPSKLRVDQIDEVFAKIFPNKVDIANYTLHTLINERFMQKKIYSYQHVKQGLELVELTLLGKNFLNFIENVDVNSLN